MNTINEDDFDYQAYTKEHPPDASRISRGQAARQRRFEAMRRHTIRIDDDLLEQFRQRTPADQNYEQFINNVLREWLTAQNIKDLVRDELYQIVRTAASSMQTVRQSSKKRQLSKSR